MDGSKNWAFGRETWVGWTVLALGASCALFDLAQKLHIKWNRAMYDIGVIHGAFKTQFLGKGLKSLIPHTKLYHFLWHCSPTQIVDHLEELMSCENLIVQNLQAGFYGSSAIPIICCKCHEAIRYVEQTKVFINHTLVLHTPYKEEYRLEFVMPVCSSCPQDNERRVRHMSM